MPSLKDLHITTTAHEDFLFIGYNCFTGEHDPSIVSWHKIGRRPNESASLENGDGWWYCDAAPQRTIAPFRHVIVASDIIVISERDTWMIKPVGGIIRYEFHLVEKDRIELP